MITGSQEIVYDWFDIEKEICLTMGIPDDMFRDYHKIVGGDYKDLWHVAIESVVPREMKNGTIVSMYSLYDEEEFEATIAGKEKWTEPFFRAYRDVMNKLDPDCNGVLVKFYWQV